MLTTTLLFSLSILLMFFFLFVDNDIQYLMQINFRRLSLILPKFTKVCPREKFDSF